MDTKSAYFLGALALALMAQAPSSALAAPPPTRAPIPCKDNYPDAKVSLRPCAVVKDQILKGLEKGLLGQEQGFNDSLDRTLHSHYSDTGDMRWMPKFAGVTGSGPPFVPACSIIPNPRLSFPSEGFEESGTSNNHAGAACGDFCSVKVKSVDIEVGCSIDTGFLGWPTGASCSMKNGYPKVQITLDSVLPRCAREESLIRGAFVQLLECQREKVESEILVKGEISVTAALQGQPSSCAELARDAMSYVEKTNTVALELLDNLVDANTLASRMETCDLGAIADSQAEPVLVAPCYLAGARSAMETAFINLAICEAHARARRVFLTDIHPGSPTNFVKPMLDDPNNGIAVTCQKECSNEAYNAGFYDSNSFSDPRWGQGKDCKPDWSDVAWDAISDVLVGMLTLNWSKVSNAWGNAINSAENDAEVCVAPKAEQCANRCYKRELVSRFKAHMSGSAPGSCAP